MEYNGKSYNIDEEKLKIDTYKELNLGNLLRMTWWNWTSPHKIGAFLDQVEKNQSVLKAYKYAKKKKR